MCSFELFLLQYRILYINSLYLIYLYHCISLSTYFTICFTILERIYLERKQIFLQINVLIYNDNWSSMEKIFYRLEFYKAEEVFSI